MSVPLIPKGVCLPSPIAHRRTRSIPGRDRPTGCDSRPRQVKPKGRLATTNISCFAQITFVFLPEKGLRAKSRTLPCKMALHILPVLDGFDIADSPGGNLGGVGLIRILMHIHPVLGMHTDQYIAENQFPGSTKFFRQFDGMMINCLSSFRYFQFIPAAAEIKKSLAA